MCLYLFLLACACVCLFTWTGVVQMCSKTCFYFIRLRLRVCCWASLMAVWMYIILEPMAESLNSLFLQSSSFLFHILSITETMFPCYMLWCRLNLAQCHSQNQPVSHMDIHVPLSLCLCVCCAEVSTDRLRARWSQDQDKRSQLISI